MTGTSFRALAFSFRIYHKHIGQIVKNVTRAIWSTLSQTHMPEPTVELLQQIAAKNWRLWGFPNCLGALDGKHVRIICPPNSGSMNYNYKSFFSTVLQGVADGDRRFVFIDVGGYGRQSDGGTFIASDLYQSIDSGELRFPPPEFLPGTQVEAPFVFLGDEAYPLLSYLMRPYAGCDLTPDEANYNERHSRMRKSIECAFGILYAKWGLLGASIKTDLELTDEIVKTMCLLHNVIIDLEGMDHNQKEYVIAPTAPGHQVPLEIANGEGQSIRDLLTSYFANNPLIYL